MNGHVLPGVPVAVDFWITRGSHKQYIHFLSHLHGDHIVGLTSTWAQPIYCSQLTAEILHKRYGLSKSLLRHLPLNQSVIIPVPHSERTFCVTAFDANHCPGALMFYFQGDFGNIFYTGDFRYSSDTMSSHIQNLHGKVDTLYLDNTFCSPHCNFPSREECLSDIINIVKRHPKHDIVIGIRKLGKEAMLVEVGLALDETIYVSPERLDIIQLLFSTNIFASVSDANKQNCRIKTVPFHQVTSSFIYKLNEKTPTIAILPSAIFTGLPSKPFSKNPNIHLVPFSDHSSFPELVEFVRLLKPSNVIPIVKGKRGPFSTDISDRLDMSCFKQILNTVEKNSVPASNHEPKSTSLFNSDHDSDHSTSNSLSPIISYGSQDNSYLSSFEENGSRSQQACHTHSKLKRKISSTHYHKRKNAKGVCYVDDPTKSPNDSKTFLINSAETEDHIPFASNSSNSTKHSFSFERKNIKVPYENTLCNAEKEENLNKDASCGLSWSEEYHEHSEVETGTINLDESQICFSSSEGRSISFSSTSKHNKDAKSGKINHICPSPSNDQNAQQPNIKSGPTSSTDCSIFRPIQDNSPEIFKTFEKMNSEKQNKSKTNMSMILSLKSVIKRWEDVQ